MAPVHTSPEKAAKYAIAASKGFSYYLPKSAQQHLRQVLGQLPSTARSVYNEYYRDLMCAKACAPDSAAAMARFVNESFPKIAQMHNAFAREMNEEIDSNEHEGYVPIKFPMVPESRARLGEGAATGGKGKKRKKAHLETTASSSKKAKIDVDLQSATKHASGVGAPTAPLSISKPSSDVGAAPTVESEPEPEPEPVETGPTASTSEALANGAVPPTPESHQAIRVDHQASSPPTIARPDEVPSNEEIVTEEPRQHTSSDHEDISIVEDNDEPKTHASAPALAPAPPLTITSSDMHPSSPPNPTAQTPIPSATPQLPPPSTPLTPVLPSTPVLPPPPSPPSQNSKPGNRACTPSTPSRGNAGVRGGCRDGGS